MTIQLIDIYRPHDPYALYTYIYAYIFMCAKVVINSRCLERVINFVALSEGYVELQPRDQIVVAVGVDRRRQ